MALPDVLDADQVLLDGGTLSNQRFLLNGGVQVALISVFPGKVVTGDYTRDTEQIASTHTWNTWTGGMLVYRLDPTTQADRFNRSLLDTRFPRQATVPIVSTAVTTNVPASTLPRCMTVYNDTLYLAWNTKIRAYNVGTNAWDTPSGVVDLNQNATDALRLRLGSTNWLVFADGDGYLTWDGTTWTYTNGDGSATPNATYLAEWDTRLWALEGGTNKLWVTSDLSTWTAKAVLPEYAGEVTKLLVFYDASGEQVLHAVTKSAVWLYDAAANKWYKTGFQWPRHPYGGLGAAVWQGTLYVSVGDSLFAYDGRTVRSLGLDREDGLPQYRQGHINSLLDGFRGLIAGTTPSTNPDYGMLALWDGVGWHTLREAASNADKITLLYYGAHDSTKVRLWYWVVNANAPTAPTVYFMDFPLGSINPRTNSSYSFIVGNHALYTPWFDANWQELPKLFLAATAGVENANNTAAHTWSLYYATDTNDTFATSSMTALLTNSTSTVGSQSFGSGAGIVAKRMRFAVVLNQPTSAWPPLNLLFLTVKYLKLLDPLYGYTCQIDGSAASLGDSIPTLFAALQTACSTQTLLTAKFLKEGQEIITRRVKVTRLTAERYSGDDGRFRATLSLSEVG